MALKTNEFQAFTAMSIGEIRQRVEPLLGKAQIRPLQSSVLDESADLEFLAEKRGISGHSAIQFFVFDRGDKRDVRIIALGEGGMARAFSGVKNTLSLSKSSQMAQQVLAALA